ncbi:MAG: hypothetical protein WBF17_26770 [Phycisphaerae bacterium]
MSLRQRSYEVLPALSVRKAELRRSLRLVTAAWGLGIIWMTCISGSWMNTFRRMLGFDDFDFGLMQALPFVATFWNLASTILIERTGLRKYLFISCMVVSRALWLVVAVILVVVPQGPIAVWTVQIVLLICWSLSALGMPAWFSWMGDLIPRRIRGRYLATRQRVTRLLQFPIAIGLAVFLDRVIDDALPFTPEAQPALMWALFAVFIAAAVFGTADILMFLRLREVAPTTPAEPRRPAVNISVAPSSLPAVAGAISYAARYVVAAVNELLVTPLRDRVFRRYVLYGATAMFAMAVGGPFYIRNMRENLGFSHLAINVMFMLLGPLVSILAIKKWGRLIDHWGRRPMLMVATTLAVFGVAPYFFASKYTPNPQFVSDAVNGVAGAAAGGLSRLAAGLGASVDWSQWQLIPPGAPVGAWLICSTTIFSGFVGWAGVMLGQQGIVLGFSDGPGRSKYVAAYSVLTSLGGVLGGVVGGLVAYGIYSASWYRPLRFGAFEWNHWHATFLLSMLARMLAVYWLIDMPDPGARRARDMVRTIGIEMYNLTEARLFYPWRNFFRVRRERRRQRSDLRGPPDSPSATR